MESEEIACNVYLFHIDFFLRYRENIDKYVISFAVY